MMISNHNRATSSFRIIEPKHQMTSYQHAQQMPIHLPHQIPILTINNNQKPNNLVNSNSANNLMYHHQQQQQQQQQQHFHQQQQQQRIRNLSDTDSSYIPGKLNSISNIYTRLRNILS
jgi:hypothetical protein